MTDEVFVTGTAAEVTPVGQVDEYIFSRFQRTLMENYDALVRRQRGVAEASAVRHTQRSAATKSSWRDSTHFAPESISSSFQNGALVLSQSIRN